MRFAYPRQLPRDRRSIGFLTSERGTAGVELSLVLPPALILLCIVTLGLALPFFAYFFLRLIINKTEIHEVS